jgi:hypothetical protein
MLAVVGTLWKHFAMQTAISGQALLQSGITGFSGGQHGISSAMAVMESADIVPAGAGVASGAVMIPTIARTGSSMRMMRQSFTRPFSHTEPYLGRLAPSRDRQHL